MKRFLIIGALLCGAAASLAQTVTVSASNLQDGGSPANGTIYWKPVLSSGIGASYHLPGGGIASVTAQSATVTSGAFSLTLPDTTLTTPANICFSVTLNTANGSVLGPGYTCVQPHGTSTGSGDWCASGACSFDSYAPYLPAQVQIEPGATGPTGPAGAAGPAGATGPAGAAGVDSASAADLTLTVMSSGSAYSLSLNPSAQSTADPELSRFQSALASGKATVLALGDSTTNGYGIASGAGGWVSYTSTATVMPGGSFGQRLQASWGAGNNLSAGNSGGVYTVNCDTSAAPGCVTLTGTWTGLTGYGIPNVMVAVATGTGNTYTLPASTKATGFDIYYLTYTDSGAGFSVAIDGGSSTTYGAATTSSYTGAVQHITGLTLGLHNLVVTAPATGNTYQFMVVPTIAGSALGGVQVINLGIGGSTTAMWTAQSYAFLISAMNPDLVTTSFDINDASISMSIPTYTSNYNSLLTEDKASGASVLMVDENPATAATGQASYSTANYAIAYANSVPLASVFTRWGSVANAEALGYLPSSPYVHPGVVGYGDIANMVYARAVPPSAASANRFNYNWTWDAPISADFSAYADFNPRSQNSSSLLGPGLCFFGCGYGSATAGYANGVGLYRSTAQYNTQLFTSYNGAIFFSAPSGAANPTSPASGWTHFAAMNYGANHQLFSLFPVAASNQYGYFNVNQTSNASTTSLNGGLLVFDGGAGQFGMDFGYSNSKYTTRVFAGSAAQIALSFANVNPITAQSSFTDAVDITPSLFTFNVPTKLTGAPVGSVLMADGTGYGTVTGVAGPSSATNLDLACFNGTTGQVIKDCGVTAAGSTSLSSWSSSGAKTASEITFSQNVVKLYSVVYDGNISSNTMSYRVGGTSDNSSNLYAVAYYSLAGSLLCNTAATAGTTFAPSLANFNIAWAATCNLTSGTTYLFATTTNCASSCATLYGNGPMWMAYSAVAAASGGTTSGAVFPSSITPPSAAWVDTNGQPWIALH